MKTKWYAEHLTSRPDVLRRIEDFAHGERLVIEGEVRTVEGVRWGLYSESVFVKFVGIEKPRRIRPGTPFRVYIGG